ncbi:hypothetical protein BH23THE1_BH23THE1_23650 [soil metagenome]
MTREFCCEKFKVEYESECMRLDTDIKYSGDRKGVYFLMFERNIASAPLVFCPYCDKRLLAPQSSRIDGHKGGPNSDR